MFFRAIAAAAAVSALAGTGALAASIDFTSESNAPTAGSIDFSNGSETVTVSATRINDNGTFATGTALIASYGSSNGGLGICTSRASRRDTGGCEDDGRNGDSHLVDGTNRNEMALIDFGTTVVRILSVTFNYHDGNDDFAFLFPGGTFESSLDIGTGNNFTKTYTFVGNFVGSLFGIGAVERDDEFKIKSIEYEVVPPAPPIVPVPAAGLLLAGGLVGLGMLRRRKA